MTLFKLYVAGVLYAFVPLSAFTYHFFRRNRRAIEVNRMLSLLNVQPEYAKAYEAETLSAYLWAVAYASIVAGIGLALLFFSLEIGLVDAEFPARTLAGVEFPQKGSRIVFAMAFLGAYLSGLQLIYRRYSANDLSPALYYGFAIRMFLAAVVAVIIFNAFAALAGVSSPDGGADVNGGITANIWPALAFLIGLFPHRGLRWLSEKNPLSSQGGDPTVRAAPLEMLEGVESHDVLRLEELGIDNCYDLASADFIPTLLKTPYSARQLLEWILQAKLCVFFGDSIKELRRLGIRTIMDLDSLTEEEITNLPLETSVTATVLARARDSVKSNPELGRLREVGHLIGMFWGRKESPDLERMPSQPAP
jgi:hypothetical protein